MPVSRTPSATPSTTNSLRTSHLALIVMIGLCLFFIVSYAGRVMQRTYLETKVVHWEAKIAQAEANTLALAAERSYVESDAYIQEKARNELGLVQPGDALVIYTCNYPRGCGRKRAKHGKGELATVVGSLCARSRVGSLQTLRSLKNRVTCAFDFTIHIGYTLFISDAGWSRGSSSGS